MKKTLTILSILIGFQCFGQSSESTSSVPAGIDKVQLHYADKAIQQSIQNKEIPGAVLAVVYRDKLVYLKAYGNKQTYPETVKMKTNTVFDLASLTKAIATATSIMILTERGKLRLDDKASMYLPDFKDKISIMNLITHTSGLPPYAPVDSLEKHLTTNPDTLIHYIASCKRSFEPGKGFQYSCLNFITLQKIIEKVSGQNLRDFAQTNIFDELGMRHTGFCPTGETLKRTAPTQKQADNHVLQGEVHDPLARKLNHGISGNAGLFSDAKDLAAFSAMLLNHGTLNNRRVLSPLSVKTLTGLPLGLSEFGRTPGWDMFSIYSSNQGDLLGPNAYGHTGYTGTSIVIDPDNQVAVILLTNRVHPDNKGSVTRLRALVANVVAGAVKFE